MKYRSKIFKGIALTLAIVMTVSVLPISNINASEDSNIIQTFFSDLVDETEASREAYIDSRSSNSAGDWYRAISYDKLPWNFFHNAVEMHIISKYDKLVFKEKKIEYKNEEGELTGKYGKVDLYMQQGDYTYIWEVKPYSYSISPKRELGES